MSPRVSKKLSANDIGITGSNQAGILVPKDGQILSFFPHLETTIKNPRLKIVVREAKTKTRWDFNFIYYNNRLFGGTRNEYRLTCMTKYLRAVGAKVGDDLVFSKDENGSFYIDCARASGSSDLNEDGVLILGSGWKVITAGRN